MHRARLLHPLIRSSAAAGVRGGWAGRAVLTRRGIGHAVGGASRQLRRQVSIDTRLLAAGVAPSAVMPGRVKGKQTRVMSGNQKRLRQWEPGPSRPGLSNKYPCWAPTLQRCRPARRGPGMHRAGSSRGAAAQSGRGHWPVPDPSPPPVPRPRPRLTRDPQTRCRDAP